MDRSVDEAAADAARARYRSQGLPALAPDERVAALLGPGERIVAVHGPALLDRREPRAGAHPEGLAGTLYVTSRRLVLVGRATLSFRLDTIEEAVLSGERLLLILHDGHGVMVQVAEPRLLRVEIAAARAAARRAARRMARPSRPAAPQPASR